jgi:DNA phosphorothioation-dependent restriction protein DptG
MATKKTGTKKPTLSDTQKIGLGVGLTAAAVAAAGTFFLYGSKGASKNRTAIKSWALKAKAEVLEKLEQAQQMSKAEYEQLIDTVGGVYTDLKQASKIDVSGFKKEMKEYWTKIEKTATPKKKIVKKAVVKAVTKAATPIKKTVTKTATKAAAKKA